jgi:hypothetical protein
MKEIGNTLPKRHLWRVYVGTSFSIASATLRLLFRQPWRPLRNQYGMATPFSWIQWAQDQALRCPALMPYFSMYCSHSSRCRRKERMLVNVAARL